MCLVLVVLGFVFFVSFFFARTNMCYDLAKAKKAKDGKKRQLHDRCQQKDIPSRESRFAYVSHSWRRKHVIRRIPSPAVATSDPEFHAAYLARTVISLAIIECWLCDDDDWKRASEWTLRVP